MPEHASPTIAQLFYEPGLAQVPRHEAELYDVDIVVPDESAERSDDDAA